MWKVVKEKAKSKDPSSKVGCVIVDQNNHQVTMGYNGMVAGIDESKIPWGRDTTVGLEFQKYGYVVHSEANAIMHASKSLEGTRVYVTLFPCNECAKLIASKKIKEVISAAKNNNCSIRIGVNAGSLEKDILEKYKEPCPEALVESALRNIKIIEDEDFFNFKVSVKSSDVFLSVTAYRQLSKVINYPLHLGITESGSFLPGSIKSSIGMGTLLLEGIGDTIRVSLSDDPVKEVTIGNEILKSLNLRNRGVRIISCPSCARQGFEVINTVKILEEKLSHIKTPITLSIIGCVVNGPGEAAQTEIGLTGGGQDSNLLYLSGVPHTKVPSSEIISKIVELVEKKTKD